MTRARRARERAPELSDTAWAMLTDAPLPEGAQRGWERYLLEHIEGDTMRNGAPTLLGLWKMHGAGIVQAWAEQHPGTRPHCWWSWDAPRTPSAGPLSCRDLFAEDSTQSRKRLGGTGTPDDHPRHHLGTPCAWVTAEKVAQDIGRARNIYGEPIPGYYRPDEYTKVALDPRDPPVFESQAAYLDRHGLFLPGERKRLGRADFEPEVFDAQGYLDGIAERNEADRQRRIELGSWAGEPAGQSCITGPFIQRPASRGLGRG